jgi:hypothetical protein
LKIVFVIDVGWLVVDGREKEREGEEERESV